jgi:ribonuclease Z
LKPLLHAQLFNAPFGDPVLLIEILWERRALLFDMGELGSIRPAKLLKVSHAFISHTHIDHFIGFDALLRLMLNREKMLKLFGPPGFIANVQGKLAGYTWNLTAGYPFSLQAAEVHPDRILTKVFHCQERFVPGEEKEEAFHGVLEEDPQIRIRATHLDHLIPCLSFSLQERFHINVQKERLTQMNLPVGPWLKDLKNALWRGETGDFPLQVPIQGKGGIHRREISLEGLKKCLTITPGQKIAYVSDCRYSKENGQKIVQLAEGADLFFCEAAFLEKDRERAEERAHLTARQAGDLARMAKVKKLIVFHFSPRYEKEAPLLYREAEEAFQG